MWEFLKSKSRKERERIKLQLAAELELQNKLEKEIIESFYLIESKRLNDKLQAEIEECYKSEKERFKKADEICPKCKSTNVVNIIIPSKGEINGLHSIPPYEIFRYGSYRHSYCFISGNVANIEINKCNDCNNEWKKATFESSSIPSWESKMSFFKLTVKYLSEEEIQEKIQEEPYYVKDVINFWSGTNLGLFKLFIQRQHSYHKKEILEIIDGKDDILINKLGFVK